MKDLLFITKLTLTEKKDLFLSILFGFITGIATVSLFASSGYLISKAALTPPIYTLTVFIACIKLLGFISAGSRYGERYFSHRATFNILSRLRVSFFEKLEPLVPAIFLKYRSGDLLSRIVGDVETLQNFFLRVFYPPIVSTLIFLWTIFFTSFFSFYIALVLCIGLIFTTVLIPAYFAFRLKKVERHVRQSRGNLSTEVTEFFYGFRDLKIYQQLEHKQEKLIQRSDAYLKEQEREAIHNLFSQSVNTFVSLIISWVILLLGVYFVAGGQLDGIFLAMLVMISLTVFEHAAPMAAFPSYLEDSRQAAARLSDATRQDPSVKTSDEKEMKELPGQQAPSIVMENVTFQLFSEILKNVSITFPAGSKTAIVGPSGSGKSTLLALLLKIYKNYQGVIRINGIPIDQLDDDSLWKNANVILQDNHFFYGTVRDNLMIAKDAVLDEDLEDVLKKVKLDYLSLADPLLERGGNLSGGEKQRLAIARVLLKKAPLWILDEPTSFLDALTEQSIYHHLFEAAKNDTVILVSHRLAGLENMDQIIVMDEGAIVEAGTYKELMNKKGYFYQMKQIEQSVFTAN
ncbi:MAG: thiol reductant ABC exporter subunit CydC [Bacillaceae bacterium]|uniref:Thiol reductant ABC exporter subunit CydC n=1 Tax=Aeribacillus pallidus TaxID=33936 RepID=A0A165Z6C8_9BACI|nr:thiol reductant ABC exporter subunit CydC [Aeribacillus pallidus]KZN97900.1 thiol reductant ABC exporter subunit CydC [Aeribacillus pallidus]REJ21020.1 MAG: thiol reductant ABC exporter subunit CydC [Bacillaceae bacterium]